MNNNDQQWTTQQDNKTTRQQHIYRTSSPHALHLGLHPFALCLPFLGAGKDVWRLCRSCLLLLLLLLLLCCCFAVASNFLVCCCGLLVCVAACFLHRNKTSEFRLCVLLACGLLLLVVACVVMLWHVDLLVVLLLAVSVVVYYCCLELAVWFGTRSTKQAINNRQKQSLSWVRFNPQGTNKCCTHKQWLMTLRPIMRIFFGIHKTKPSTIDIDIHKQMNTINRQLTVRLFSRNR